MPTDPQNPPTGPSAEVGPGDGFYADPSPGGDRHGANRARRRELDAKVAASATPDDPAAALSPTEWTEAQELHGFYPRWEDDDHPFTISDPS